MLVEASCRTRYRSSQVIVGCGQDARRSVGLGLFIVRAIARAHGGDARVSSSAEGGTTFTIDFPREP
jgi:signal transduction histidine kinase